MVRMVEHKMHGMTLRLIDTPGLQPSSADIQYNSKVMAEAKKFTKRHKAGRCRFTLAYRT